MVQPRADIIKMFYTQIVFISCILEKKFLCSSSRRFLYRSRPYWRFLSFSSSERFWYLSCASFWSFSFFFFFYNSYLSFLYIDKKIENTLSVFLYALKINFLHHNFLYQNFLHQSILHQNFFHQNFLYQNFLYQNQKKFLCHQ